MKRNKLLLACLACMGAMLLTACGTNTEPSADTDTPQTSEETGESSPENDSQQEYEYPEEDAGPVLEESRLGYSMTYDPTVFTLDDTGEGLDIYTYHTAEVLDGPAYMSIASYEDMDAQTLADGIVLQSGQDGVAPQATYFGADSLDTLCVSYEEEVDGVTQVHAFYAVPKGEGSLLVEITGYLDMPLQIQAKFEEMAGTFALLS